MRMITKRDKRTTLEKEIDEVIKTLSELPKDSEEYTNIVANLEVLYKAKSNEKISCVSPDTVAVVVGNLMGILIILGYEKANVITTKALGFVMKGRV